MQQPEEHWVELAAVETRKGVELWSLGLDLAYLAAVLRDEGIGTLFDPCPPGEGFTYPAGTPSPVRLFVRSTDLERALTVMTDLLPPSEEESR